jgi:four helix bundle protein
MFTNVGRHACFAKEGMHAATPPSSRFQVLEVALQAVETLRPVVARIRQCDRDLGEQIRRALSSVALNIGEGSGNEGGTRLARFSTAAGSNAEVRAALRVAVAWGYVSGTEVEAGEQLLDRIAAMLYRLGARR